MGRCPVTPLLINRIYLNTMTDTRVDEDYTDAHALIDDIVKHKEMEDAELGKLLIKVLSYDVDDSETFLVGVDTETDEVAEYFRVGNPNCTLCEQDVNLYCYVGLCEHCAWEIVEECEERSQGAVYDSTAEMLGDAL